MGKSKFGLPKYVHCHRTRHGKMIYYYCAPGECKVRLRCDPGSEEFLAEIQAAATPAPRKPPRPDFDRAMTSRVGRTMVGAVRAARTRSRMRGTDFDLTADWALDKVRDQGFKCALTGIPFFAVNEAKSKVNPFIPSFDRIDCSKGYTKDNVRIVCWAINAMLLDWGEEVFTKVANQYRTWKPVRNLDKSRTGSNDESYRGISDGISGTYGNSNGLWCGREK